jgi:hypothetical protein
MFGCNNDVDRPTQPEQLRHVTVDTPTGKIMILNASQHGNVVTADVVGAQVNATFQLINTGDNEDTIGGRAELLDPSGQLLYSIESRFNKVTGKSTITQATADDYMTLSIVGNDERTYEAYDANGEILTFDYPTLPEDTQRRAVNYYQHGLPASRLPADIAEYVGGIAEFDSYYERHRSNTLEGNPNAELLVQILTAEDMPLLVVGEGSDPHVIKWIQQTCATATACRAAMCYVNPASTLCAACTAIAIACTIFDMICSWYRC